MSIVTEKVVCPTCEASRNCIVHGVTHEQDGSFFDDLGLIECARWRLLKCAGCDTVFVEHLEWIGIDTSEASLTTPSPQANRSVWPGLGRRPTPKWLKRISSKSKVTRQLHQTVRETYIAYNQGLNILASIGLRTSFDLATEILEVPTSYTFSAKLDELVSAGHILEVKRRHLETLVELGNASAHRGHAPNSSTVEAQLIILENFLHDVFIQPAANKVLEKRLDEIEPSIPKRVTGPRRSDAE